RNVAPLHLRCFVFHFIRASSIIDFLHYFVSIFTFASRLLHLQLSRLNFSIFVTLCHFAVMVSLPSPPPNP
ncbi:hypothetical protein VIGAN_06137000, partial [Vigna angularis var. angularis]